jgi:small subunit ribosomal protein S21e
LFDIQINVGKVDASGKYTGENHTFALNGYIRNKGESDHALTKLYAEAVATEKKD